MKVVTTAILTKRTFYNLIREECFLVLPMYVFTTFYSKETYIVRTKHMQRTLETWQTVNKTLNLQEILKTKKQLEKVEN